MMEKYPIAVLYAGGRYHTLKNQHALNRWNKEFIELEMVADAIPVFITGHTTPDQPQILQRIARRIQRDWKRYDGFVVTMDYAHVLYNANLLAFMLGRLTKPVVISTISHDDLATIAQGQKYPDIGLKASIVNATQMMGTGVGGTFISFGSSLIPVAHALVREGGDRPGIYPTNSAAGGYIDFGIRLRDTGQRAVSEQTKPELRVDYGQQIVYKELAQGLNSRLSVEKKTRGLILDARRVTLSGSIARFLPKQIPAIVLMKHATMLYANDRLTEITNLTPNCAAAKFTWLFGQRALLSAASAGGKKKLTPAAAVKAVMDDNVMGEHLNKQRTHESKQRVKPGKKSRR